MVAQPFEHAFEHVVVLRAGQGARPARARRQCRALQPGRRQTAAEIAARWLVYGEQIQAALEVRMWPQSVLRDETMAVLGIADLSDIRDSTRSVDYHAALAEAAGWLAQRDPSEKAARVARSAVATS